MVCAGHAVADSGLEPGNRLHGRAAQQVEPGVLRRLAGQESRRVLAADAAVCHLGLHEHCAGGIQVLRHAAAGLALARLDDAALHGYLAGQLPLLPSGVAAPKRLRRRARQPRPAHTRRHCPLHRQRPGHEHGPAQCHGHAGVVHRHFVDGIGQHQLRACGAHGHGAGLYGVGGHCVLRRGQRVCPYHRPQADSPELLARMARGRLSLQPGAPARIQRSRGL